MHSTTYQWWNIGVFVVMAYYPRQITSHPDPKLYLGFEDIRSYLLHPKARA